MSWANDFDLQLCGRLKDGKTVDSNNPVSSGCVSHGNFTQQYPEEQQINPSTN